MKLIDSVHGKWIDINDRLPPIGTVVKARNVEHMIGNCVLGDDGHWYMKTPFDEQFLLPDKLNPTHWMPIEQRLDHIQVMKVTVKRESDNKICYNSEVKR